MHRFLTRSGFAVTCASEAEAAWVEIGREQGGFDLLILDLTLPGLSGLELLSRIRASYAELRVLLCSGYPFDASGLPQELRNNVWFVQKPFSPRTLLVLMDEILVSEASR